MKIADKNGNGQSTGKQAALKPAGFSLQSLALLDAWIVTLIGAAGLLGWLIGLRWLTAIRPEYNSMRPNAALGDRKSVV